MMKERSSNEIPVSELLRNLADTLRFLTGKWLLILVTGVLLGLVGVLYAWLQKPDYIAQLTFVTENDKGSELGMYAGIAAQFGIDIGSGSGGAFEGDNLIELLKSRNLVEKTLLSSTPSSRNLLIERYLKNHDFRLKRLEDGSVPVVHFDENGNNSRVEDSILYKVYENIVKTQLEIERVDKKLNLISITMKDSDEPFAKEFTEKLSQNVIQYYTDYKSKRSRQNVQVLQKQTDSVRSMLFGNISEVAAMNDLNVNPIRQSVKTGSQRKQIDVQVNGALYGELLKNLELSKIVLRKETPLIQIIDAPKYPLKKKKLGRLLGGFIFSFAGVFLLVIVLIVRRSLSGSLYILKDLQTNNIRVGY
jgi:uncharacterized protein involved in exopolysaccharide biosynthesis